MAKDNVIDLKKPEQFNDDPITEILQQGARQLLATALEAEIEIFLNQFRDLTDDNGRLRIVRNAICLSVKFKPASARSQLKFLDPVIGSLHQRKIEFHSLQLCCRHI